MLKIKKDVDLKKLQKFGFKREKRTDCIISLNYEFCYYSYINKKATMDISEKTRQIDCNDYLECMNFYGYQDLLYDLIQANLVEKVEE